MRPEILDDPEERRRLDPSGMLDAVGALPVQCREAWRASQTFDVPPGHAEIDRVVILGMGGSAIAGDILRALLSRECTVPIFNVRQYELPAYVDERTLVIASSFSGDTEETVSAFSRALATRAKTLAITTGGSLLTTARANGVPAFTYEFGGEPRAALGWNLMALLAIAHKLGLAPGMEVDLVEALKVMGEMEEDIGPGAPASGNEAKRVALQLHDRLPVIYGAEPLTEVARRWKTQLNESAKVWCFYEELPEADHNAIIGYDVPQGISGNTSVVFLRSDLVHPRVLMRYDFTQHAVEKAGAHALSVTVGGRSALAQVLSGILFGDYVSCYLALLNGVDATPTTPIDELKAWLAEQP
jgi:glucose/mannose-6-phosphate isomerase